MAFHWNMVDLPEGKHFQNLTFPLLAASDCQQWDFIFTAPLQDRIGSGLSLHRSCVRSHNSCEFICATVLLCTENTASL